MRVLVLSLPRLGVQLAREARPELAERPLGLLAGEGDSALLTTVSVEATADGVEPGMTALQARQRCPGILLEPDNAGECLDRLAHLTSILRTRTTTDVAVVSRTAVALDLSGIAHRFADEQAAAQAILALARSWARLDVRCGVAATVEAALCAASRARRHPLISPDGEGSRVPLPVYSPVSVACRAEQPLAGPLAEARIARMLTTMQPLLDPHRWSFRAVRAQVTKGAYETVFVLQLPAPIHTAAEAAAILRTRLAGKLDGVTELRLTLDRPGPEVSVRPWRQPVATVHELTAPAVPVQRRLLLRAS
jgi:hypothetical protein